MSHGATTETKATVTLTINGRTIEVPRGTTILKAAGMLGYRIPTMCYLEKLRSIGSCRVCSVEVEGVASPVMSCNTPVAEGMTIYTDNERIREFRKNMIEFILVNHPLDCPVCERSGECRLQNLTMEFGIQKPHWNTTQHKKVPWVDWGLIQLDRNLCVMCERCVVICREVQGCNALTFSGTGYSGKVDTVTGEKLDCDFCGQCISVCPVGALSSGMGFAGRSWEMEKTQTVCPHCGVGCSFHVNVKSGKIVRVTSSDAIGNNNGNLCARGRFGYEFVQSTERLTAPMIRKGHGFETTDWDTALNFIADKLKQQLNEKDAFVGIGSERATNEDNYVFQKFFREVLSSGNLDNMANMANAETASRLFDTFGDFPMTCSFEEMKEGNLFIFVGLDGSNENPVVSNHIRESIYGHGAEVALLYSKEATFLPFPKMKIVYDFLLLQEVIVALLRGVVKNSAAQGAFPHAVSVSGAFEQALKGAGERAEAKLDDRMKTEIDELVRLIRAKGKPVFLIGQDAQRHPQKNAIVQNIVNLARVTGGKVMVMREYCNTQGVIDMGVAPNILPGHAEEKRNHLRAHHDLFTLLDSHTAKVLIIADEDPMQRHPDFVKVRSSMDKADFVVVTDHFYTQTAMAADVVLPSCTSAEKDGTFTNIEGRIQRVNHAVEPVGQSKPVWEIFSLLAKKMGKDFGYAGADSVSREIGQMVPMYKGIGNGSALAAYRERLKTAPAAKWVEPTAVRDLGKEGKLVLLPEHSLFALGIYTDYCPSLRHLLGKHYADFHVEGKPYVEISPADAGRLGVNTEDTVIFRNPKKEWKGRVRINPQVRPGTLHIPADMDQLPSVKMVVGTTEIECVNMAGLEV